jgi:hypothetical protein
MVENCISSLGVDPAVCRGDQPGQWNMKKGSANVWIDVFIINENGYFQCMAPVSAIPQVQKAEFYEEILETNHKLYGVGMTKFKDWIYVKTIREVEDLSEDEIMAQMNRIGVYADDYDDYFKNKYFPSFDKPGSDFSAK